MRRRDLAQTKRLIAYVLDTACATADVRLNPAGRISCLFDLSGALPRAFVACAVAWPASAASVFLEPRQGACLPGVG